MSSNWTENDLLIAMNLYCKIPFGQFHRSNSKIVEISEKMGRTPSSLAMKLSNLASLDPYHQNRGVVGLRSSSKLDREIWENFQSDWSIMAEKSEEAFESLFVKSDAHLEVEEARQSFGPSTVERTVKTRRLQGFFRNTVLSSYDHRCAVSGVANLKLLNASHIIPWKEAENRRADPTNGLCLNAIYDRAFDRGLITFDEDFRMVLSSEIKKSEIPTYFEKHAFTGLEGHKMSLPTRFAPDQEALEYHRENIFAA